MFPGFSYAALFAWEWSWSCVTMESDQELPVRLNKPRNSEARAVGIILALPRERDVLSLDYLLGRKGSQRGAWVSPFLPPHTH